MIGDHAIDFKSRRLGLGLLVLDGLIDGRDPRVENGGHLMLLCPQR